LACGKIGLSIADYYNLTQRQFYNIAQGYSQKQQEIIQTSWEQTRQSSFINMLCHGDGKKTKNLTPQKWMPFPWEDEEESAPRKPKFTNEQLKEHFKNI
jgi:hypothetical protein